jgi:hypothetical protein
MNILTLIIKIKKMKNLSIFTFGVIVLSMTSCNNKSTNENTKTIEVKSSEVKSSFSKQLEMLNKSNIDSLILNKNIYTEKYTLLFPKDSSSIETNNATPIANSILENYNQIVIKKEQILKIDTNYYLVYSIYDGSALTIDHKGVLIDKILLKATMGNSHVGNDRNFTFNKTKNQFTITDEETNDGVSGIENKKELFSKNETIVKVNVNGKFEVISQKEIFRYQF